MTYEAARRNMVDGQIHTNGVVDARILSAFAQTPRELFVPEKLQSVAYHDADIDLGQGRFLLEPFIHAKMVQLAQVGPKDVVLDVGSGTGYSATILSGLSETVIALEGNKRQSDKAAKLWAKLGLCNIVAMEGALTDGVPQHGPYHVIMINGAVERLPEVLLRQLAPMGRLVAIVKPAGRTVGQVMMALKTENGHVSARAYFDAASPYFPEFAPQSVFRFG